MDIVHFLVIMLSIGLSIHEIKVLGIRPTRIKNSRLSGDVIPLSYNITIFPRVTNNFVLADYDILGRVLIDIRVNTTSKPVDKIVMHSKGLTFVERVYWEKSKPNDVQRFKSYSLNNAKEELRLVLQKPLEIYTVYTLRFSYIGHNTTDRHGYIRNNLPNIDWAT